MYDIFGNIIVFLLGVFFGWIVAHSNISTECNKLNSFYVGDKVYHCEVRSWKMFWFMITCVMMVWILRS